MAPLFPLIFLTKSNTLDFYSHYGVLAVPLDGVQTLALRT